jgi:G8 domain
MTMRVPHIVAVVISVWSACSSIVIPIAATVDIIAPVLIDNTTTQRSTRPPSQSNQVLSTLRYSTGNSPNNQPGTTPRPFPSVSLAAASNSPLQSVQQIAYPSYSPGYDDYVTGSPHIPPVSPTPPTKFEGEIQPFATLTCNVNLTKASCQRWTSIFGTSSIYTTLIVIPCGTCVIMDFNQSTNGSSTSLELLGGIDIHGKLVLPDTAIDTNNNTLSIITTMIIVQGELIVTSKTKPINGQPNIRLTLIGQNIDQSFIPIDNNAMACTLSNIVSATPCVVGKKAIVVAGGKVSRTYI